MLCQFELPNILTNYYFAALRVGGGTNVEPVVHLLHVSSVTVQRVRLHQQRVGRVRTRPSNGRTYAHLHLSALFSDHHDSAVRLRHRVSRQCRTVSADWRQKCRVQSAVHRHLLQRKSSAATDEKC